MFTIKWLDKDIEISANVLPGKKRPSICIIKDNVITPCGYFTDERYADIFMNQLAELIGAKA